MPLANLPYHDLTGPLVRGVGEATGRSLRAPPEVGQRSGNFYRDRMLYLPTGASLATVQSKLTAAGAGTTRCHVAWIGTSIVEGYGASAGSTDMVSDLRDLLTPGYGVIGSIAMATNGDPAEPDDVRYTMSAGWGFGGGPRIGATPGGDMQMFRRASLVGETLTFTSDVAGTVVDIHTFGNGKAFQYSIDGGVAQTTTPSGSGALQTITVTGLANTTHTVTITTTVAGNYTFIAGIAVRKAIGLDVTNLGYYGSVANDWQPGAFFYSGYNLSNALAPDIALIQLGANECIHGYTTTQLYDALDAMAAAHKAAGRQVVMIVDPPIESDTVTTWDTFRAKIYDVADGRTLPLIDLTEAWGSRAQGAANGYYFDQWHPNATGASAVANTVFKALTTPA